MTYSGVEMGSKIATFSYYEIFRCVDPYQGSTSFRILITSVFSGIVSSLLGVTYLELVKVESKYIFYAIAYIPVIIQSVKKACIYLK